jgi:hypothetical protein
MRPHSPQCIEQPAVCNTKSGGRNRFVTLFGIPNSRLRPGVGGGGHLWKDSIALCNPAAMEAGRSRKFSAGNQGFLRAAEDAGQDSRKRLQKDCDPGGRVPGSGRSLFWRARHLGGHPGASQKSWECGRYPVVPAKSLNHYGRQGRRRKAWSSLCLARGSRENPREILSPL